MVSYFVDFFQIIVLKYLSFIGSRRFSLIQSHLIIFYFLFQYPSATFLFLFLALLFHTYNFLGPSCLFSILFLLLLSISFCWLIILKFNQFFCLINHFPFQVFVFLVREVHFIFITFRWADFQRVICFQVERFQNEFFYYFNFLGWEYFVECEFICWLTLQVSFLIEFSFHIHFINWLIPFQADGFNFLSILSQYLKF